MTDFQSGLDQFKHSESTHDSDCNWLLNSTLLYNDGNFVWVYFEYVHY